MAREIPSNLEAEECILGAILFDSNCLEKVINILTKDAFYGKNNQLIYGAILELYNQGQTIDLMTVTSWLKDHHQLKSVESQLTKLADNSVSSVKIDDYTLLVLDKYYRRQLIKLAAEINDLGYDTTQELPSIFEQVERKIFKITQSKLDKFEPITIGHCLGKVWQNIQEGNQGGFLTGLTALDELIGGLNKQDLIVIAARASMGKTWLGCYLANYIAVNQQLPVVFFSAEMSREQLTKRFLSLHSKIDSQRLINQQIYKSELETLANSLKTLKSLPIIIDDTPAGILTPNKMRSVLRRLQAERGELGLVIMDYIQKLGDRAASNRAQTIGAFSGAFKDLAKEFDVPLIALAQINRGVESQTNKRPTMADIKDSGDIEQDMDLGLLLYRDEYYHALTKDKGIMEINVAKNRNGKTGICRVLFDAMVGSFGDI
jgi:replicative DNA helicase